MGCKKRDRLFNSKRGMDIDLWFNTFELLVVFIVGLTLFEFVSSESTGSAFEKNYLARDNSLLINTIYSSPGDLAYNYSEETEKYIIDFKQNRVEVYEEKEFIESGAIGYPYSEDKNYGFTYKKLGPTSKISYIKTKEGIIVANFKEFLPGQGNSGGAGASIGLQK